MSPNDQDNRLLNIVDELEQYEDLALIEAGLRSLYAGGASMGSLQALKRKALEIARKLDYQREAISKAKEALMITPNVPSGNDDTKKLLQSGNIEIAMVWLIRQQGKHAGHLNNLGCAYLLHTGMSVKPAGDAFDDAADAADYGNAKKHAEANAKQLNAIKEAIARIKDLIEERNELEAEIKKLESRI